VKSETLDVLPSWVAPSEMERALDPLGLQEEADALAAQLLPGVTVQTSRVRYLSFLCWAKQQDLTEFETDRWEVAMALGEHMRHRDGGPDCSFLGKNKAKALGLGSFARVPTALHQQTARILYAGLLTTSSAVAEGALSVCGNRLAEWFRPGRRVRPRRLRDCAGLPCLSWYDPKLRLIASAHERRALAQALLLETLEAKARYATYRAVPVSLWAGRDAIRILRRFLDPSYAAGSVSESCLHRAAAFELAAFALKRLFLRLYRGPSVIRGRFPARTKLPATSAYVIRDDDLLHDVSAHLRRADALGATGFLASFGYSTPGSLADVVDLVRAMHEQAKPEAPWVDARWKLLRPGLAPSNPDGIHGYRLPAFASLIGDLGLVGNRSIDHLLA
jgi:hypothetical protein